MYALPCVVPIVKLCLKFKFNLKPYLEDEFLKLKIQKMIFRGLILIPNGVGTFFESKYSLSEASYFSNIFSIYEYNNYLY